MGNDHKWQKYSTYECCLHELKCKSALQKYKNPVFSRSGSWDSTLISYEPTKLDKTEPAFLWCELTLAVSEQTEKHTPLFLCGLQTLCSFVNSQNGQSSASWLRPCVSESVLATVVGEEAGETLFLLRSGGKGVEVMAWDDWWAWGLTMWQREGEDLRVTQRITKSEPRMLSNGERTIIRPQ